MYHRERSFRRRKYRLRRYGAEPTVFLERKSKLGDRVSKRRTQVPDTDLARLGDAFGDPDWAGHWYHQRLLVRQLRPTCQISYERVAYVGACAEGPLRLTLDRHIHCVPADGWSPDGARSGLPILAGQVILELKYSAALPAPFKRLIAEMALAPSQVSKYRLGVQSWGLDAGTKEVG